MVRAVVRWLFSYRAPHQKRRFCYRRRRSKSGGFPGAEAIFMLSWFQQLAPSATKADKKFYTAILLIFQEPKGDKLDSNLRVELRPCRRVSGRKMRSYEVVWP